MAVFDYRNETFSPSPCDQLVCGICHCVFYNPVEFPCQHMFCQDCIEQWLRDHGTCPECRETAFASSLTRASRVIRNVILNLKILCQNSSQGCQEICSVEHYEAHKKNCPYQLIKCPNGNCGLEVMQKDKAKHEDTECVFYMASCPVCREYMIRHKLLDHDCFHELKSEVEFTKQQLYQLQDEKSALQAQVADLNRRQEEMLTKITQALYVIQDLRGQKHRPHTEKYETVWKNTMETVRNTLETVQNVAGTMQNLLNFSQSQLNRVSIFLKNKDQGSLSYKFPKPVLKF